MVDFSCDSEASSEVVAYLLVFETNLSQDLFGEDGSLLVQDSTGCSW